VKVYVLTQACPTRGPHAARELIFAAREGPPKKMNENEK
jgi:hypothetical protein